MNALILESWLLLLYFDWVIRLSGFREVHQTIRHEVIRAIEPTARVSTARLCQAVDYACVFYFKRVLCLQRSAATSILLRRHGWDAEMVIGTQILPFRMHAWCEVSGSIVNDKPYVREMYAVLERVSSEQATS